MCSLSACPIPIPFRILRTIASTTSSDDGRHQCGHTRLVAAVRRPEVREERDRRDRDHPGGEAVQPVDEVHRVHQCDDPQDGERHGEVRRER